MGDGILTEMESEIFQLTLVWAGLAMITDNIVIPGVAYACFRQPCTLPGGQMSKTTTSVNAYWSGRPRNCEAYALALSLQPKRPRLTDTALGI